MIARSSQLFLPTLRDAPADAEAASHKLLVRGGFIRQVSAGVWTFMPLGWRVHRKIERIIREEMDAIGAQEMLMPVLTPAELWEATGRAGIPEIFHVHDRTGRHFILPMTHEETVTFHAREIQSYKQLPQLWYHFSVKDRDEPRPRGGLLRVREFIMKDGYSFDRDEDGVRASFEANREAYKKIFARCGLETYDVQAESGIMGGKFSIDFLAPSGSGENTLVICENGDYAGDIEVARAVPAAPVFPERLDAPQEVETPGGGSLGPIGFSGEVVADDTLRDGQFVAGANRDGWHLRGVEAGRDFEPRFADLREPREGDRCPECGGALRFRTAVEVGHIFNFGSFYSKPLEATFLDEDGREKPLLGGSYGIGPGRVMAAVVEQHHDEQGIAWPDEVAPYDVHVISLPGGEEVAGAAAEALSAAGKDVLLDDRADARAGEKFADADLIGVPLRVTAGKKSLDDGAVDVRVRATGEERRVNVADLGKET
jgi:prolyl-tRNA synthetase